MTISLETNEFENSYTSIHPPSSVRGAPPLGLGIGKKLVEKTGTFSLTAFVICFFTDAYALENTVLPRIKPAQNSTFVPSDQKTDSFYNLDSTDSENSNSHMDSNQVSPETEIGSLPARQLFGNINQPAPLETRSIGFYSRGCLSGAMALEQDGPNWQVMRLSRNRYWGHPKLIEFLKDLAEETPNIGWNGLLVGDLAQPRGGPMLTGHASHQIGLDADIWLLEMPDRRLSAVEREKMSAVSMLKENMEKAGADRRVDEDIWTVKHAKLIRRAAKDERVARIFVSPAIKKALCEFAESDRNWLSVVRPWWGHHYHFHVRLKCPEGNPGCQNQDPPPSVDGCGKDLDWWLSDEPWVPKKDAKPVKRKEVTMAGLPKACTGVLTAN